MTSARVLLLVSGGIAAYKSCFLARLLQQAGFSVKVAMTDAAQRFVAPMTFQVLTNNAVATDLWGEGQSEALDHIEYARWADLVVVAPATANTMAKAARGIADDIVSTLLLAFPGPVLMAPAMNDQMWAHPATQENLEILQQRGVQTVGPGDGFLACGTNSRGRMSEPEDILASVRKMVLDLDFKPEELVAGDGGFWRGKRLVVTAGPTQEALDPVRFLSNRSSGAMGYALASAGARAGARVHLISGPVGLAVPRGLEVFEPVVSAREMGEAVARSLERATDWLFMAAAVADYSPREVASEKIKKAQRGDSWTIALQPNPDILAEVVPQHRSDRLKVVGFALETAEMLRRAAEKRNAKNMDYIVANNPTESGAGFGTVDHRVTVLNEGGVIWQSESMAKERLAVDLMNTLADTEQEI